MENGYFEIELLGIHPTDRSKDMRVWIHGTKTQDINRPLR